MKLFPYHLITAFGYFSWILCNLASAQELPPSGLVLWLDATHGIELEPGDTAAPPRVAVWTNHAVSSQTRVSQDHSSARPQLITVLDQALVRFDGQDDHLLNSNWEQEFDDFTVCIVFAPRSNNGNFRGPLAWNKRDGRDYQTGFNIDQNSGASLQLTDINVEGAGFGGARNLLSGYQPFGTLQRVQVVRSADQVHLIVNGKPQDSRPATATRSIGDELTIGARHYENGTGPQRAQGFFHGDIADVIIYDRALTSQESQALDLFLETKHQKLAAEFQRQAAALEQAEHRERLLVVENLPAVQMLVPGFTVDTLPLNLTNQNNLRYRNDGKLITLGYDGNMWIAWDSDGDGREDTTNQFFNNRAALRGPIGMAIIPEGHKLLVRRDNYSPGKTWGVVVASKGKVSAIIDDDGDDRADAEEVIASGWQEIPQNVDAVGIAIDATGNIYFGLGTAAYNNAYLLNEQGQSAFDLHSERGTIQVISTSLEQRSTLCTGVRFPIGMEFDQHGELFISDQEGATWLPNGNPFDELLHIQPGKHYGFPPRHPRHLPAVFDMPSTFDYGPQHQSTCGMTFNRPAPSGDKTFGPAAWKGDLFVCGESRGKLYRTRLVRDSHGNYVAQNNLIGCLGMLTVDCCITPSGDLLVACHSGGPDWGTGPSGPGTIYRIHYSEPEAVQPVAVELRSPNELVVDFSRPLDPNQLTDLKNRISISYGEFVSAGDRFESIRPGYAVTQFQQSVPRYRLPIYSLAIKPDLRSLVLTTAPQSGFVGYALRIDGLGRVDTAEDGQHPSLDLAYWPTGVVAKWQSSVPGSPIWTSVLPHLDMIACQQFVTPEKARAIRDLLRINGRLQLDLQLNLLGWLKPAVQPNSQLDYAPALDDFIQSAKLVLESKLPFHVTLNDQSISSQTSENDKHSVSFEIPTDSSDLHDLQLELETGPALAVENNWLSAQYEVRFKDNSRQTGPIPLHRFVLPWASRELSSDDAPRHIPELASGNWGRGRREFFRSETGCSKCHQVNGQGATVGPDLSNLVHRDYASVKRDILQPSFAINPDYITHQVLTKDGQALSGVISGSGDVLTVADQDGKLLSIPREEIETLKPSPLSIMPVGTLEKLGEDRTADLLTFLLLPSPRMPTDAKIPSPPLRDRQEVINALAGSTETPIEDLTPRKVILVAGAKDHGPGEHDYPAWLKSWGQLLPAAEGLEIDTAMEWPTEKQMATADALIFFQRGSWTAIRAKQIEEFLERGGGLVYIHWAIEAGPEAPEFAKRIGLASDSRLTRYRHGPIELGFDPAVNHPIARNFDRVQFYDETYWALLGDSRRIDVLARANEEDAEHPQYWTMQARRGRVFVSIPGHYSWTFDDPLFRILLLRGLAWTMRDSVDRFNSLVTLGVQFKN
ncbi:MAG: ThuA domain-containing protein [Planctomycetales bacterium]|nr:ThuA domain-containing protein [Planctomycetales bacterium]